MQLLAVTRDQIKRPGWAQRRWRQEQYLMFALCSAVTKGAACCFCERWTLLFKKDDSVNIIVLCI